MRQLICLLCGLVMVFMASCSAGSDSRVETEGSPASGTSMLEAFCSTIDFGDTAALHNERLMRNKVSTIVRMLGKSDSATVRAGMSSFFSGLRHDETTLVMATGYLDHYLYSFSSPVRNEELYIGVLSALLDVDSLPAVVREPAAERLRIASLNRPGTIANDIVFETRTGARKSLHSLSSPLTLVVFYNPECSPCSAILKSIAADPTINAAISEGRMDVVAIYAEGNKGVWHNNLSELPANWTVGYDLSDILDNELYDLPAMPTLYLLDADKRVLMKDPDYRLVSRTLRTTRQTN